MTQPAFQVMGIPGLPMVQPGDELAGLVLAGLAQADLQLCDGDVLCIAQKVVSKAEGRLVALDDVQPSAEAIELVAQPFGNSTRQNRISGVEGTSAVSRPRDRRERLLEHQD